MSSSRISLFAISMIAACSAVACSASTDISDDSVVNEVSDQEALTTKVTPGSFKLYSDPNPEIDTSCDRYTRLELSNKGGATATLSGVVGGTCEIHIRPDDRFYRLRLVNTACGSKTYAGSFTKAGVKREISITDHRERKCRDLVPAKVIVDESRKIPGEDKIVGKYYSFDRAPIVDAAFDVNQAGPFAAGTLDSRGLEQELTPALEDLLYTSEGDYPVKYFTRGIPQDAGITARFVMNSLKSTLFTEIYDGDAERWGELTAEYESQNEALRFVHDLANGDKMFAQVFSDLSHNLHGIRLLKIGPKDAKGALAVDRGLYVYVFVGYTSDHKLAGVYFGSVET